MNAAAITPSNFLRPRDTEILDILRELISEHVDLQDTPIDMSTELRAVGVDSLTAAEIVFSVEDRLGILLGEPAEAPATVGDVVGLVLAYFARRNESNLH